MSAGMQVAMAGAIGGTAEAPGGAKFANGPVTGAYVMMFNHLGGELKRKDEPYYLDIEEFRELFEVFPESMMSDALDYLEQLGIASIELLTHPVTDAAFTIAEMKIPRLKGIGVIPTIFSVGYDSYQYFATNEITGTRYAYRMTSTGITIIAAASMGPVFGPIVGGQLYFYERMWDTFKGWYIEANRHFNSPNFILRFYDY